MLYEVPQGLREHGVAILREPIHYQFSASINAAVFPQNYKLSVFVFQSRICIHAVDISFRLCSYR
jgi:hypothetical protein